MATQRELVRGHLTSTGSISSMEAWNIYKIRSLSSRISELKRAGYMIRSEHKHDLTGQRYVRYHLENNDARA